MINTDEQKTTSRALRAASATHMIAVSNTNKAARDAAAASLPGAPISLTDAARVGRLAIEAERAHTALLIARAAYFRAHPAA
jgi:hypothetical protein